MTGRRGDDDGTTGDDGVGCVYIPIGDTDDTVTMIGRVYDSGESEYIADDGKGWKPDTTGIFYRRRDDPAYGWMPEAQALAIITGWERRSRIERFGEDMENLRKVSDGD